MFSSTYPWYAHLHEDLHSENNMQYAAPMMGLWHFMLATIKKASSQRQWSPVSLKFQLDIIDIFPSRPN